MSDFQGVDFLTIAVDPNSFPEPEPLGSHYSVRHIPSSDADVLQVMGRGLMTLSVEGKFANRNEYNDMRALTQTKGTLTYRGRTYNNAVLLDVGAARQYARNVNNNQEIVAAMEFVMPWDTSNTD